MPYSPVPTVPMCESELTSGEEEGGNQAGSLEDNGERGHDHESSRSQSPSFSPEAATGRTTPDPQGPNGRVFRRDGAAVKHISASLLSTLEKGGGGIARENDLCSSGENRKSATGTGFVRPGSSFVLQIGVSFTNCWECLREGRAPLV